MSACSEDLIDCTWCERQNPVAMSETDAQEHLFFRRERRRREKRNGLAPAPEHRPPAEAPHGARVMQGCAAGATSPLTPFVPFKTCSVAFRPLVESSATSVICDQTSESGGRRCSPNSPAPATGLSLLPGGVHAHRQQMLCGREEVSAQRRTSQVPRGGSTRGSLGAGGGSRCQPTATG